MRDPGAERTSARALLGLLALGLTALGLTALGLNRGCGPGQSPEAAAAAVSPPRAAQIASGDDTTCLRAADGAVWCWGSDSFGARGFAPENLGGLQGRATPVPGIAGAEDLQMDRLLGGCARGTGGALACWGDALMGRLGDGRNSLSPSAGRVRGLSGAVGIATSGRSGCAVLQDRTVWCWGDNLYGQVGDGTRETRLSPVPVLGLTDALQVVMGTGGTCARRGDGTVWCWGWEWGAIGDAHDLGARPDAWAVPGLTGVVSLAAGDFAVFASRADGALMSLGATDHGLRGDARLAHLTTPQRRSAEVMPGVRDVVQLAVGHRHACAVRADGAVWCWGENDAGQRGDGTVGTDETRELRSGSGEDQTCLRRHPDTPLEDCRPLSRGGAVLAYGPPSAVVGLPAAKQVAVGGRHSCAVTRAGEVWCWGENDSGQLGLGSFTRSAVPVRVAGLTGVRQLALGRDHSCARREDGTVWCWGRNEGGTLEDDTPMRRAVPGMIGS